MKNEENLALRMAIERDARDWSYEELARRMGEVGCKIAPSALFKIEKGTPRRRVTVDELVALGAVFNLPFEQLVLPVDLVLEDTVREVIKEIESLQMSKNELQSDLRSLNRRLRKDPVLARLVEQWLGEGWVNSFEIDVYSS